MKEALVWSAVWIVTALLFNLGIWWLLGRGPALDFLAGYLIEKSLSVDNLFVFLVVFDYFQVKPAYQHRVLFWGIFGALVMRAAFIGLGVTIIQKFHWMIYVFGVFLIYTGYKLATKGEEKVDIGRNPVVRFCRNWFPLTDAFREDRFTARADGRLHFTPLFVVLLVIETTDVVFALDSIPAILAITTDPFIVYSSNVFAILGLRALYFALAGVMKLFRFLNYGLAFILAFVGVKMLVQDLWKIPTGIALGVIALTLVVCVILSLVDGRVRRSQELENGGGEAAPRPETPGGQKEAGA